MPDSNPFKIAWIISPPSKGSGGFRTICSKAAYLESRGFENHFFILPGAEAYKSPRRVLTEIVEWFSYAPASVEVASHVSPDFDAVIATAWNTAEYASLQNCKNKLYFIQDFEPWFYPRGEKYYLAEQSYRFLLRPITMGKWLSKKVSPYYGFNVPFCRFGVDCDIYRVTSEKRASKTVCAIFQPEKDRRLSNMLLEAARLVIQVDPGITFELFGSGEGPRLLEPNIQLNGVLSMEDCAKLYASCAVGVSLSASNPSRIPFEMLACGLTVVELNAENNRWDYPEGSLFLADPSPMGIASAVLESLEKAEVSSGGGRLPATPCSIDEENKMFFEALSSYLKDDRLDHRMAFGAGDNSSSMASRLSEHYGDNRAKLYTEYSIAQTPFNVNRLRVRLVSGSVPDAVIFRMAVWLNADQSDLRWCEFTAAENGLVCECAIDCNSNADKLAQVHLYAFCVDDSAPVLLRTFHQLVTGDIKCHDHHVGRNIQCGEMSFEIDFDLNRSEPCANDASDCAEGGQISRANQYGLFKKIWRTR